MHGRRIELGIMKKALLVTIVCFVIPGFFTLMLTGVRQPSQEADIGRNGRVRIDAGKSVTDIGVDDYIAGVLASRLEYGSEPELIKTQAVMIRTQIYRAMKDSFSVDDDELAMTYISKKERMKLWQGDYEANESLIEDCIAAVSQLVMRCNNELINCPYTYITAGKTRSMSDGAMPWLKQAECPDDSSTEQYISIKYISNKDFVKLCSKKFASVTETASSGLSKDAPLETVQIVERDQSDYVNRIKVGNIVISGEEFADALGLASPCFFIEDVSRNTLGAGNASGDIRITVRGSGSGYGLSINQAAVMARQGSGYDEILKYFFNGISIENL
jgi:stage II sporulation protein D